jgi:hypothetical protein
MDESGGTLKALHPGLHHVHIDILSVLTVGFVELNSINS